MTLPLLEPHSAALHGGRSRELIARILPSSQHTGMEAMDRAMSVAALAKPPIPSMKPCKRGMMAMIIGQVISCLTSMSFMQGCYEI